MDQMISGYENLLENLFEGLYFVDADRTIIRWNKAAEKLTGFTSAEMLGKHCSDNLLNHVDENGRQLCIGHCPLVKVMNEGLPLQQDVFLHHKNGHRLPVQVRAHPLCNSDGTVVGAAELFTDLSESSGVMQQMEDLKRQALTDSLTGLPNRACLEGELERCLDEYKRYGWNIGLLFLDVDHFKAVNDTFGHDRGDEVLQLVATTLARNCRASDIVGRWGGEEFVGLVRNATPSNLQQIAERNRMLVERSFILVDGRPLGVTISLGAVMARPGESAESLVRRADQLMFESKNKGRNCVSSDVR